MSTTEQKTQYEAVAQSEDGSTDSDTQKQTIWVQGFYKYCLVVLCCITVIFASTAVCVTYTFPPASDDLPPTNSSSPPEFTQCGTSPAEARSRGCFFDVISFAWQTPLCYDPSLMEEFLAVHNWTFYTDFTTAVAVPLETVLLGEANLMVTWQYHITHCGFLYLQMHRAFENGYIDSHLHSYKHSEHCRNMIMRIGIPNTVKDEDVFTRANLLYPTCDKVGEYGDSAYYDKVYGGSL